MVSAFVPLQPLITELSTDQLGSSYRRVSRELSKLNACNGRIPTLRPTSR
jgi:hypothetical protein